MTGNTTLLDTVDEMLRDAGETDPGLRAALLSLGAFASLPVPEPRGELAALLAERPTQLDRHRLRRRHRTAAVGLAVIAGMGLGVTGVAATASGPKSHASSSIQQMLQDWVPSWTIAGTPATNGSAASVAGVPAGDSAADAPEAARPGETDPETARSHPGSQGWGGSESDMAGKTVPGGGARSHKHDSGNQGAGNSAAGNSGADHAAAIDSAPDDAGSRKAAGGTGAGAGQDKAAKEAPPREVGSAPAGMLEKTGKLVTEAPAVVGNVASTILDPARNGKTGASDAGPGSIWLKKFNR
ncbi:hypothetical protein [Pseudarthrobacter sulfonivorans]|uniref:hypothetical protein n=1 Tax=Pseudarthrobacter sulfonivorans TaxID=121292 RepID=UPI002106F24A|nr:hypothetical protein [Pseudarthrobacter sulfonivorans]